MYEMPRKVLKIRGIFIVDFLLLFKLFILLKKFKIIKKVVDKRFVICYYNLRA